MVRVRVRVPTFRAAVSLKAPAVRIKPVLASPPLKVSVPPAPVMIVPLC